MGCLCGAEHVPFASATRPHDVPPATPLDAHNSGDGGAMDARLALELRGIETFYQDKLAHMAVQVATAQKECELLTAELRRTKEDRNKLLEV